MLMPERHKNISPEAHRLPLLLCAMQFDPRHSVCPHWFHSPQEYEPYRHHGVEQPNAEPCRHLLLLPKVER